MSRPLRIEFPGAVYHVTSRGDRREAIFEDDADRQALLALVDQAMGRFDAQVLAYCLMSNHYHFVLYTRQPNLSRLMRHLNGVYTQSFNRRHGKVGHLFQGRFKAILVDRDAYLLEVCRYVELNPVRRHRGQVLPCPQSKDGPDQWCSLKVRFDIIQQVVCLRCPSAWLIKPRQRNKTDKSGEVAEAGTGKCPGNSLPPYAMKRNDISSILFG